MAQPKILLYLMHSETGQRYPISLEKVVIGRSSGDIVFPRDPRISSQHCRLFFNAGRIAVEDLDSANGTFLNGEKLNAGQLYTVEGGAILKVGDQEFKAQIPSRARPVRRRGRKRGFDFQIFLALAMLVGAGFFFKSFFAASQRPIASEPVQVPLESPFEMVQKEIKEDFADYTQLGLDRQSDRVSEKEMSKIIRTKLSPAFSAARAKLAVLKPGSELERRKIEANKKLLGALIVQVDNMALFAETKNPKYNAIVEKISHDIDNLNADVQKLNQRIPASAY
jgi:hypothetical protein